MSATRTFIDANVLLYSLDGKDIGKRDIARKVIAQLCHEGNGYVSMQVVNEFAGNLVRKFGMNPLEVSLLAADLSDLTVTVGNMAQVHEALGIMSITSISYWDACMVSSAKSAGCRIILTEELSHGQLIAGVKIINPFK